jgi:hypothetical protein
LGKNLRDSTLKQTTLKNIKASGKNSGYNNSSVLKQGGLSGVSCPEPATTAAS